MRLTVAITFILTITTIACAQSRTNRLYRPCPGVGQQARVEILRSGDIDLVPCVGKSLLLNGVPYSNGFTVSGTGRTNYIPYFSSETNLAKSPFSWNGSIYTLNNASENSPVTLQFAPDDAGYFRLGTADTQNQLLWTFNPRQVTWQLGGVWPYTRLFMTGEQFRVSSQRIYLGDDIGESNSTYFSILDDLKRFTFAGDGNAQVQFNGINKFVLDKTLFPVGCGGVTANTPTGTVNICTGSTSVQVDNSTVTADSIVLAVARTYDASCSIRAVVPNNGNFIVYMTAACAGDTSIGWLVLN